MKSGRDKSERLLPATEMTRYRGGLGSIGWLVDNCCPQLSFDLSERRRLQEDATIQDMLKLSTMIRSAKSIEFKLKIRSVLVHHLRFMGVHDAARGTVEGGSSQQVHLILIVHKNCDGTQSASIDLELEQQEDRESCAPQFCC